MITEIKATVRDDYIVNKIYCCTLLKKTHKFYSSFSTKISKITLLILIT